MFSFGGWGKKPYSKFSGWLQPQSPRRPLELCRYKSNLGMALTADGLSFTTEQTDAFGGETEMLCIFTSKKKKKKSAFHSRSLTTCFSGFAFVLSRSKYSIGREQQHADLQF